MALVKDTLRQNIYDGLYDIFTAQALNATEGDEQENPDVIIKKIAGDMATVIANAVDTFVKSGDISVGPTNVQVTSTSPGTPATVAPLQPAKMK
jgi:hypothetical protein